MQLAEIENSLPSGFHDALLESINIDYVSRTAVMKFQLSVGDPDATTEQERETYKRAELLLRDVVYFVIDAPDPKWTSGDEKAAWVDAGSDWSAQPPVPNAILPEGAFSYSFFCRGWGSFLHVAAGDAALRWL